MLTHIFSGIVSGIIRCAAFMELIIALLMVDGITKIIAGPLGVVIHLREIWERGCATAGRDIGRAPGNGTRDTAGTSVEARSEGGDKCCRHRVSTILNSASIHQT